MRESLVASAVSNFAPLSGHTASPEGSIYVATDKDLSELYRLSSELSAAFPLVVAPRESILPGFRAAFDCAHSHAMDGGDSAAQVSQLSMFVLDVFRYDIEDAASIARMPPTEDMIVRAVASIPVERRSPDVSWLVLEADAPSGGWFLYLHRTLDEASTFDSWHRTRMEALQEAHSEWGVRPEDWRPAADSACK